MSRIADITDEGAETDRNGQRLIEHRDRDRNGGERLHVGKHRSGHRAHQLDGEKHGRDRDHEDHGDEGHERDSSNDSGIAMPPSGTRVSAERTAALIAM